MGWKPLSTGKPSLVITRPSADIFKPPSRVYAFVPSGNWTSRKPSPCKAMSSLSPVCLSWPWVNTLAVDTTRLPLPSSTPAGSTLLSLTSEPDARCCW